MPRVREMVRDIERRNSLQDEPPQRPSRRLSEPPTLQPTPAPLIHPLLRAAPHNRAPPVYSSPLPTNEPTPTASNIPSSNETTSHEKSQSPSHDPITTLPRSPLPNNLVSLSLSSKLSSGGLSTTSTSSQSTKVAVSSPIPSLKSPKSASSIPRVPRSPVVLDPPQPIITTDYISETPLPPLEDYHPIPSKTVFARGAPILALPLLDNYLSKIPAPKFKPIQEAPHDPSEKPSKKAKNVPPSPRTFIPLQELRSGRSLADLFYNAKIAPPWRNRNSIFNTLVGWSLGVGGSTIIGSLYSLSGILDFVQVFALILSTIVPHGGKNISDAWRKLLLGTIPNILALNFFTLIEQKLLFFSLFALCAICLLCIFHRYTRSIIYDEANTEGLYRTPATGTGWGLVWVSFTLCLVYLPISIIAVHGLMWSSDFWPVNNSTGIAASSSVCYTTASAPNQANLAPLVVMLCVVVVLSITIYFPLRLRLAITACLPSVDRYTELGKLRSEVEMEHEYQRRLARDRQPFSYLYSDYRRQWGTYKSIYLIAKLSALLIIAVFDPSNCVLYSLPSSTVLLIRQIVLIAATICFLILQTLVTPFIDPVSNASEWNSRVGYVTTSILGIGNLIGGETKTILEGPVLYVAYFFMYGLNVYFTVVHWSWMQRVVKRIANRVDFSIDIFSPLLDITADSPHIRRRIWQETISTLFLTSPGTKIPPKQAINFVEGWTTSGDWPPYLLHFQGSAGERHVENIKILREVGGEAYRKACSGPELPAIEATFARICEELVGPDAYWEGVEQERPISSRWGNLWCIPFPPTVVLRFDDGKAITLNSLENFRELLAQNHRKHVLFTRHIRRSLRALEGQIVYWPYTHTEDAKPQSSFVPFGKRYSALSSSHHEFAKVVIKRHGRLVLNGYFDFASGFEVSLVYSKKISLGASDIGITADYFFTPQLASFFALNERTIRARLPLFYGELHRYRELLVTAARTKSATLSYAFLEYAFERPCPPDELLKQTESLEPDVAGKVMQMMRTSQHDGALGSVYERMRVVTRSGATAWWYLFWDDFWRRNHATVKALTLHEPDFNPWYPSSIAYQLLPRAALDAFLLQRGLLTAESRSWFKSSGALHSGLVNRLYFHLNEIVYERHPSKMIHTVGTLPSGFELPYAHHRASSEDTGGGTDHDDSSIRERPLYRYEELFMEHHGKWRGRFAVWFGLTPFAPLMDQRTRDISLELRLDSEHHQYIRL
ncbi:hypothetical protein DL93DRAFT_2154964 [Clavulina sp. PMI_390]|nr:hypothetical protein DL93DRAFT_2154964 [Clavulina sp. PMI_390]